MAERIHVSIAATILLALVALIVWASPLNRSRRAEASVRSSALTSLAGQTTTLLPDGNMLVLGGEGTNGPVSTAAIENKQTGEVIQLPDGLLSVRGIQRLFSLTGLY